MAMSTHERAKKAAAARWAKTTPEERKAVMDKARAKSKPKPDSHLKKVRTEAAKLGYRLVPIEEASQ